MGLAKRVSRWNNKEQTHDNVDEEFFEFLNQYLEERYGKVFDVKEYVIESDFEGVSSDQIEGHVAGLHIKGYYTDNPNLPHLLWSIFNIFVWLVWSPTGVNIKTKTWR